MPSNYVDAVACPSRNERGHVRANEVLFFLLWRRNEVIGTITPTSLRVTLKIRCRKDLENQGVTEVGSSITPLPLRAKNQMSKKTKNLISD